MTPQAMGNADKLVNPTRAGMESSGAEDTPLAERVGNVRERARNLYQRTRERAVELEGHFEDYVREHPVKSVVLASAIGAGVGLLVGVLVSRR
jgi:ElaB/YqjD/DUF883 family membrane-anchored ribosome-binding protein